MSPREIQTHTQTDTQTHMHQRQYKFLQNLKTDNTCFTGYTKIARQSGGCRDCQILEINRLPSTFRTPWDDATLAQQQKLFRQFQTTVVCNLILFQLAEIKEIMFFLMTAYSMQPIKPSQLVVKKSDSADGDPRSQGFARLTLRSAPHRHQQNFSLHVSNKVQ